MAALNREDQAVQLALVAIMLLRLSLTDDYLRYLKPGMRPLLLAAAVGVTVLAVVTTAQSYKASRMEHRGPLDDADHMAHGSQAHTGGGNLPWFLALLFVAACLVRPSPLGSYSAARQASRVPPPPSPASDYDYPPLPELVDGAHELSLSEFTSLAWYDSERQLSGQPIRLVGFVTPADGERQDTEFLLTRFILSCCAVDGIPVQVTVKGLPNPPPPADTWLAVEGLWQPAPLEATETPVLLARSIHEVPQPTNPYEA